MENETPFPKTLIEAVRYFSNQDIALAFMASLRWPNGVICPHCNHTEAMFLKTRRIWKCKACRKQFTIKTGTIMEDSPIKLDKWLPAIWLIVNAKNGISSYEVHRALGVTQKTAWFLMHRIRLAMQAGSFNKMSGEVEVDETFIGGKSRNMHKKVRDRKIRTDNHAGGRGPVGKVAVMGLLERHGEVRTMVVMNRRTSALSGNVALHVEKGATVYTDSFASYDMLQSDYIHNVINHAEKYVDGIVHTNGIENFWSLLKRTIGGTYVSVEPFHLFRYLDEQSFRFNNRKASDLDRFLEAAKTVTGRRLTLKELTGKPENH